MLAISERVRPWSARCSPRSVGRVTISSESCCSTAMSRGLRSSRLPRGPLTRTTSGSIVTVTPVGTGMGCLPIRDISSPDVRDHFAADALAPRLVTGHHALGRGKDRRAHAALDLWDLLVPDVRAPARGGDALHAADHRLATLGVLQPHAQHLADPTGLGAEGLDVALLVQDARELGLELGSGHVHELVIGAQAVANAREEVRYRVCHRHVATSSTS